MFKRSFDLEQSELIGCSRDGDVDGGDTRLTKVDGDARLMKVVRCEVDVMRD